MGDRLWISLGECPPEIHIWGEMPQQLPEHVKKRCQQQVAELARLILSMMPTDFDKWQQTFLISFPFAPRQPALISVATFLARSARFLPAAPSVFCCFH